MDLLIKNARFTDPETGRESAVSAGIKDGKICSLQWEGESREESEGPKGQWMRRVPIFFRE